MNIYRVYLRTVLALGFVNHTYRMTERWGALVGPKKSEAAWETSQKLVQHHGYHSCPGCTWAVKNQDDHTKIIGSWCHNEDTLKQTGFTLDDIEEMQRLDEEWRREEPEMHPAIAERRYAVFEERLAANIPGGIPVDQLIGEEQWNSLK